MRSWFIALLLAGNSCMAQYWMGEFQAGVAGYNGDLTQHALSLRRIRPSAGINLRYNSNDFVNFRMGVSWGTITASDKFNKDPGLRSRNLSFTSNILEAYAGVEANLLDPETHSAYPYFFAAAGIFHFDPYAYDNTNKKVYLKPLGTEGQGLQDFPDRKPYSLLQLCVPLGAGIKWKLKKGMEISYEFAYRFTFTDYLDDVSKSYVELKTLQTERGPKTVEMSYRRVNIPFNELGEARGNPKVKDLYYFSGIKLALRIGSEKKKDSKQKKKPEAEKR